jgi:hypothetical protein
MRPLTFTIAPIDSVDHNTRRFRDCDQRTFGATARLVTDHLTRWIHHPESHDDITIVVARKRPAAG